ncbi:hypothetical protein RAS1_23500 [Phycisphaerae bacterium RAS1]|nr:hypothetical protein RAS1_23500 [Phycisphaerae bacterium RAS1]
MPNPSETGLTHAGALADEQAQAAGIAFAKRTPLALLQAVSDACERVESRAAASPDRGRRACRAGCSSCCFLAVSLTAPEALYLAAKLREIHPAPQLEQLTANVRATSQRVSHLTIEARASARIPCAFLGDAGECTIHPFRPLGCRGWTSFSKDDCDAALAADEPGHSGPMDKELWQAAGAVTEGLERAARVAALDAGQYELHAALLRALTVDAAADRFVKGDQVFSGCGRVTSERLRGPVAGGGYSTSP